MKHLLLAVAATALIIHAPHAQDLPPGSGALRDSQESAKTPSPPCSSPECTQFDFWIGEWVVEADGAQAGINRITKILDGCVIMEEWEGSNFKGKSFNRYDPVTQKWEQYWVDNQGGVLRISGGYADGKMVMSGESVGPTGPVVDRITWHNKKDGTVRQVWEKSTDGGKTWTVAFDGLYRRKD